MKKMIVLTLSLLLILSLSAGCGTTSAPSEPPGGGYSPDGSVIFEQDGVKVTTAGLDTDPTYEEARPIVWISLENTGDRDVYLGVTGGSVNGIMTGVSVNDYYENGSSEDFGVTVPAGQTVKRALGYSGNDAPGIRMDTLGEMEFCVTLSPDEGTAPAFTSEPVVISTGEAVEKVDITTLGTVVLDNDTMTLVLGEQDYDEWFGPEVYVYVANKSDRCISVFPETAEADGVSCDSLLGGLLAAPGKLAAGMISFDGETKEIKGFENLTVTFRMGEAETFSALDSAKTTALDPVSATYPPQVWGEYENSGLKLEIRPKINRLVTVETPEADENGVLFSVSETASMEAGGHDGAGWLFSVSRVGEEKLHELLCFDMSGTDVFGKDGDGNYFLYLHPTDVRYERATPEEMQRDAEQWSMLCEWAESVKGSFTDQNGLEYTSYGNSEVDMYLARAAWDKNANATLSAAGSGPVEGKGVDGTPYAEFCLRYGFDTVEEKAPDGEAVVLSFPDEDVRLDFFTAPGGYVRVVSGGNETLYQAVFTDDGISCAEAMQGWYNAAAELAGGKPHDESLAGFYGQWSEKIAGRGVVTAEPSVAPGKVKLSVSWPESASVLDTWDMIAALDGNGRLVYENGHKEVQEFDESGESWTTDESFEESGYFYLSDAGELMWHDNSAEGSDDAAFVK